MRPRRQFALCALTLAMFAAHLTCALAQSAIAPAQSAAGSAQPQHEDQSDQTLEIAPRIAPPPPAAEVPSPAPATDAPGDLATPPSQDDATSAAQHTPATPHAYLGIAVQTVYSNDRSSDPAVTGAGVEVVSVDHNSPAAIAGLRGRTKMTSVAESGATVSSLVPPLELLMVPLLKKTGSLGQRGDLIVAIDDRRIANDFDLQSELETFKPGDLIYFTITRSMADGSEKTLKLPIKLGDPAQAATAAANDDAVPLGPATAASAQHP